VSSERKSRQRLKLVNIYIKNYKNMGKYRKKELPKTSIDLRSQSATKEESKDNGVLGLQQISSVSANLRVGLIVKRKNANRLKACKICGRKFGSNWA
jgi:hypothetical protein